MGHRRAPSLCASEMRYFSLSARCITIEKTATHRLAYPVHLAKIIIPNLYNRASAVDSSFNNQPQVGKPTWGYDYPTVLRRLPFTNGAIHRHRRKNRRRAVSYVSTGLACLPRDTNPFASTAEERLYMSTHPSVCKSNDTHTQYRSSIKHVFSMILDTPLFLFLKRQNDEQVLCGHSLSTAVPLLQRPTLSRPTFYHSALPSMSTDMSAFPFLS